MISLIICWLLAGTSVLVAGIQVYFRNDPELTSQEDCDDEDDSSAENRHQAKESTEKLPSEFHCRCCLQRPSVAPPLSHHK